MEVFDVSAEFRSEERLLQGYFLQDFPWFCEIRGNYFFDAKKDMVQKNIL